MPGFVEVTASLTSSNKNFVGWGFGETEDLALAKAFAELAERIVRHEQKFFTSNGMAAHSVLEDAASAAKCELLERDLFLCHFLTKTPFKKIAAYPPEIKLFLSWISDHGATTSFFELGATGAVCVIDGRKAKKKFGLLVSAAYKSDRQSALLPAFISVGRRVHKLLTGNKEVDSIKLSEFENIENPDFMAHGKLSLNIEYANEIAFLFESEPKGRVAVESSAELTTFLYRPNHEIFLDCPLYVVRAHSSETQDLYLGFPTDKNVNLKRVSKFSGKPMNWSDMLLLPHPFN